MRTLALALSLGAIVLALAALARAQAPYAAREVVSVGPEALTVETVWTSGRRRTATVTAALGGRATEIFSGATVRTAAAARPDALAVVAYHGGDEPFARVLVSPIAAGRLGVPVVVELDRSAALARSATLRPAAAVIAATPGGFAVIVQEQEIDPTADVQTTLTVLDAQGAIVEATHGVSIPWQLAALAARDGGYELAVIYGAGSSPEAPSARACIVGLGPTGEPIEHPWWASDEEAYQDVAIAIAGAEVVLAWRAADGVTVRATRWAGRGGWATPPANVETLGRIPGDAPLALSIADGGARLVVP